MATQPSTQTVALEESAVQAFRADFRGELVRPGDAGYDSARRIWNGAIDRHPALIARCTGATDVIRAVTSARSQGLLVAVRGGGHGVAGTAVCDGGLVIDLSPMRGIRVDPIARTARAEAGVLWGELDRETQAFGLATTGGIVTHTGIAGLTLGGGIGWLMRKHGLTIDNLLSADLVTADGALLTASAEQNAGLFWGMRGGGGNFGVVTSFKYRLHPVGPAVLAGPIYYAMEDAPALLRFYREYIRTVPDEFMSILNLRHAPAVPFLPREIHGKPVVGVAVCYAGPPEEGERLLRPLRRFGTPLADLIAVKPYRAHQSMFDPVVPHGWHYYWKSWDLMELDDRVIDVIVAHSARITSPLSYSVIFQLGGAVGRVAEDATAYSHRDARHNININAVWTEGDPAAEEHIRWARDFYAALEPLVPGGVYVNFLGDEGEDRVRAAYGKEKYERLAALKNTYDPTNLFRLNQNIRPTRSPNERDGVDMRSSSPHRSNPA
jgi:FAD/FMN-containing dehydrogenase